MGPNRSTHEIYRDIIRAIHYIMRVGERPTVSRIGLRTSVPNTRLKKHIVELGILGLLDQEMVITQAGYVYLEDCAKHLDPFLRKYRLNHGP